ncbi:hypothetical protein [Desulfovibrio oxyclinae]|uniref:hypothetical protein n=1 Tax=Desulfovibrio oxyclinae TaxID=63560 RepID=UPI00036B3121|nr:hypothetical protein [Desulfovibrio oxyclinae]
MHKATVLFKVNMDFESLDDILSFVTMRRRVEEVMEEHGADVEVSGIKLTEVRRIVIPLPPCVADRCCCNCRHEKAEAWETPCLYCENASEWEVEF